MRTSDTDKLGFVAATRETFAWLVVDYGFAESGNEIYSVAFRGTSGWLTVIRDRLSYELDVALALNDAPEAERPYGMADLIRASQPHEADRYRCFAAATNAGMRVGLQRLADDLRRYGGPALAGDQSYVERLAACRDRAIERFAEDQDRRTREPKAAAAVRRGDWAAVIALYEPIEHRLDPVAAKRLALARKRLDRG